MGIIGFNWGNNKLTLLQNRDNWETRVIKKAAWVNDVLGARCEVSKGTWFGVTESGRVAFVDSGLIKNMDGIKDGPGSEKIVTAFLESRVSPEKFFEELVEEEKIFHSRLDNRDKYDEEEGEDDDDYDEEEGEDDDDQMKANDDDQMKADDVGDEMTTGRAYRLILADITSGSMLYISKPSSDEPHVNKEPVAFGVHSFSLEGLDSISPKDRRLRSLFNEMIGQYENQELPPMRELAARFMYDPTEAVLGDYLTALFVDKIVELLNVQLEERFGTTSTTAFSVNPSKQAMFYERYLEDGQWKDHNFTFNIA